MQELITEIAIYLGIAAFLGFLLGWLVWGVGRRRRNVAIRTEAAGEARAAADDRAALRSQLATTTRERDQLAQRVRELNQRLAALETAVPDRPPDSEETVDRKAVHDDAPQTLAPVEAEAADDVATASEDSRKSDDLTRIVGIGKSTAATLNDRGIRRFSQLADLSPDDADDLRAELGLQQGELLDTWSDQARKLMAEE